MQMRQKYKIHDGPLPASQLQLRAEESPVVPVDAAPILAFGQKMNSVYFARHPSGDEMAYSIGPLTFGPRLAKVELFEHKKSEDWSTGWTLIASSGDAAKPLPGTWLAESDPLSVTEPSPRRLQLWTDNPLIHSGRASGPGSAITMDRRSQNLSLADRLLEDYPDLMRRTAPQGFTCVRFDDAAGLTIEPRSTRVHHGLRLSRAERERALCRESRYAGPARRGSDFGPGSEAGDFQRAGEPESGFQKPGQHYPAEFGNLGRGPVFCRTQAVAAAVAGTFMALAVAVRAPVTRFCLAGEKGASLQVIFPGRVKEARIQFCGPLALPTDPKLGQVATHRRPVTLGEVKQTLELARKNGDTPPDFQSCTVRVNPRLSENGDTWTVADDKGFHCLRIELNNKDFAVLEICYLTVEQAEEDRRAGEEAGGNIGIPRLPTPNLLKPGAYYRLEVTTEVEGAIDFDQFGLPDGWLGEAVEQTYRLAAGALGFDIDLENPTKEWSFEKQTIFFQTEGPPANLRPYVSWSSPSHQDERVFLGNDIAVRFLRSGMEEMIEEAPSTVELQVRDAVGNPVAVDLAWKTARSATRFPEEAAWDQHRKTLESSSGWPAEVIPDDDVWIATPRNLLQPKTRYSVEICRTDKPTDDPARTLHSFSFTTSAFPGLQPLVQSFSGQAASIQATAVPSLNAIQSVLARARAYAAEDLNWQRALVDYRFELQPGGRAGLEEARMNRRKARAEHDDAFRNIASSMADPYYQSLPDCLEAYLVRNPQDNEVICIWLRSPESLDLRMHSNENINLNPGEWIGRTEISLASPPLKFSRVSNVDSTQVLLFPALRRNWVSGRYVFKFTYHQDHGDQDRDDDHRYDRPVESSRVSPMAAEIVIDV